MFKPKYRVLLKSKCFHPDNVVCLGTQLISIINSLKGLLPEHIWYVADVDAMGKNASKYNFEGIQLITLGTDFQFIEYCSAIDQFIWGVFLCIDSKFSSQDIRGIELVTEDEQFRPISCDGILLEIRAFDTTFFEIFSEDFELLKKISEIYSVTIEKEPAG